LDPLIAIAFFVIGLTFGSFLNVCISRIPHDESIIQPRSHCRSCQATIAWGDNIPVLSWLLLRGRCRTCGDKISLRYPAVELLTATAFVACYASFGLGGAMFRSCAFCFLVIGLIFMDAETGLLPAEFTYPGILVGVVFAWFVPTDNGGTRLLASLLNRPLMLSPRGLSLADAIVAAVIGAAFFYLAWAVYYVVRKRDGLGFGDIAFIAMIGAFLGLKLTVLVIFLAPVTATVIAVIWMMSRRNGRSDTSLDTAGSLMMRSISFGVYLGA
jgi:leader peptidase (prepilin peptidase)/N-methyltransferase